MLVGNKTKEKRMLSRITLLFIFLHQPPESTNLLGQFQASSRFQTSSPQSRTLIYSKPCFMVRMIVIFLIFNHSFAIFRLVDCSIRRPIAFGLTKLLSLIFCSLVLGLWLFNYSCSCQTDVLGRLLIQSVGGWICWPVVSSIRLELTWLMLLVLFLQTFSLAVQDVIILLNNYVFTLGLHQDCLRSLQDYLNLVVFYPLWSSLTSRILQGWSVGTPAITSSL